MILAHSLSLALAARLRRAPPSKGGRNGERDLEEVSGLRALGPLQPRGGKEDGSLPGLRHADHPTNQACGSMKLIEARFRGRCRYCKIHINPGDRVYYENGMGGVHEACHADFSKRQALDQEPDDFTIERYREERE